MSAPRTLAEVTAVPDEVTVRRLLALLAQPAQAGGLDAAS